MNWSLGPIPATSFSSFCSYLAHFDQKPIYLLEAPKSDIEDAATAIDFNCPHPCKSGHLDVS
jgi:hypothetical protein